jgi:hypothetical protein
MTWLIAWSHWSRLLAPSQVYCLPCFSSSLFPTCLLHDRLSVSVKLSLTLTNCLAILWPTIRLLLVLILPLATSWCYRLWPHILHSLYILSLFHFSSITHIESILPYSNANILSAYLPDLVITMLSQTTCQTHFSSITHNITHNSLQ